MHRTILEGILLQDDSVSLPADTNTRTLIFARRIFKSCIVNGDVPDFSLDIDTEALLVRTVITNNTILDFVSAAAAKFVRLIAKQYPYLAITLDYTPFYNIVRVTVSYADSISAVIRQHAILCKPVRNAPAEENPLAIAPGQALLEDRPLGAASGMESKIAIIYCLAV